MVGLLSEQVHLIFFQIIHLDISTFDMFHVSSEPLTLTLKWTFLSPTPIKDTPTMGKLDRHFGSCSSIFCPNAFVPATSNNDSVWAKNGTAGTKMAVELTYRYNVPTHPLRWRHIRENVRGTWKNSEISPCVEAFSS